MTELNAWKGKDVIEIQKVNGGFMYIEHRKSKETGEVKTIKKFIPLNHVSSMAMILDTFPVNQVIKYREIVKKLIENYGISVSLDAFNGGKNRAEYYFPLYYYPLKILESKAKIQYKGSGEVILLR